MSAHAAQAERQSVQLETWRLSFAFFFFVVGFTEFFFPKGGLGGYQGSYSWGPFILIKTKDTDIPRRSRCRNLTEFRRVRKKTRKKKRNCALNGEHHPMGARGSRGGDGYLYLEVPRDQGERALVSCFFFFFFGARRSFA